MYRWVVVTGLIATLGCAGLDADDDQDEDQDPAPAAVVGGEAPAPAPMDAVEPAAPKVPGMPAGYEAATIVEPPKDTNHDFDQDGTSDTFLWAARDGDHHLGLIVLLSSGATEELGFDKDLSSFGSWYVGETGEIVVKNSDGDAIATFDLDLDSHRHR
jgi:hypothetical protein